MDSTNLIFLLIAGAVFATVFGISRMFVGGTDDKLRSRLNKKNEDPSPTAATSNVPQAKKNGKDQMAQFAQRIGQAAAQPFMPKTREKQSTIKKSLARAGIYSAAAGRAMVGAKVILLGGGVLVGYVVGMLFDQMLLGVSLGGLLGYMAPVIWLKGRIKSNQYALTGGLPDALDLMVVCVEAGLTVDAAMQRVGTELAIAHPSLSRELGIAHMETRVGLSRSESMKNLAVRTGNAALQSLAAMLIQADRFGTSIAQALRVHADTLRTARQQAAEEMAAKASVKMSFPLVLFIFPATFIVLAGPAVLKLMTSDAMK